MKEREELKNAEQEKPRELNEDELRVVSGGIRKEHIKPSDRFDFDYLRREVSKIFRRKGTLDEAIAWIRNEFVVRGKNLDNVGPWIELVKETWAEFEEIAAERPQFY